MIEQLEPRRLLSARLSSSELLIKGTDRGDEIIISCPTATKLRVTFNGSAHGYLLSSINRVEIFGKGGNDVISVDYANLPANRFQTYISGGVGDDSITGYQGKDSLFGGVGNDSMVGGLGNDLLDGSDGNDILVSGAGNDTIRGGNGDDSSDAQGGVDQVDGGDGLDMLSTFAAPGAARKMVWSEKHNLLFMLNSGSAIRVIDLVTHNQISVRLATNSFTDIDLSPSGDYLFAADFGGEETGYGSPSSENYVQRYNLATRSWEGPRDCPGVVYKIEAVDDDRLIALSSDQWTTIELIKFDDPDATLLSSISGDYYGDIEYDPNTGRIFQGNTGSSSAELHVYKLTGDTLGAVEYTGSYSELGEYSSSGTVLSTDGQTIYYDGWSIESLDVTHMLKNWGQDIIAAGPDFVVSPSTVSDTNGHARMKLGVSDAVIALNENGDKFIAYSQTKNLLYQYG